MTSLNSLVCNEELANETDEDLMESEAQRKDNERQEKEDLTEEPKRFTRQERARGFSKHCSYCEAQDLTVEWYREVATALQNAIQYYRVLYEEEKKRATNQTSPDHFFKGADKIASSKEPESVPSTSGVGEFVACPLSPIADDAPAIPRHVSLV